MSAATLRARLDALQCHFTWDLDNSRPKLLHLWDDLEDIGAEEGYPWLGHIYNLQAYFHFQLASQGDTTTVSTVEALRRFGMATEAFRQVRNTVSDEGPWLMVNYGNLAWLHFHMGEQAVSLSYVRKVEALLQEYPCPVEEEVHQEVLAEKAWTFMKFDPDRKLKAVEYFKRAIRIQPNVVEWRTSHALALARSYADHVPEQGSYADHVPEQGSYADHVPERGSYADHVPEQGSYADHVPERGSYADHVPEQGSYADHVPEQGSYADHVPEREVLEILKRAMENDPENVYIAAVYLERLAKAGKEIEDEARTLAKRVLKKPCSSYSGMKPLLRLYRQYVSLDEAIDVADEALERQPNQRFLKRCLASCYKWKIFSDKDGLMKESITDRAITLYEEVISLYPRSSLLGRITLANLYAESTHHDASKGERIFKELLESKLESAELQMLYNNYAKYLNFYLRDRYRSIEYHMKAAEIPHPSNFRKSSMTTLKQIQIRRKNRMCGEIEDFLANLQKEHTI